MIGVLLFIDVRPKTDEVYLNILNTRFENELSAPSPCTALVISRQEYDLFKKYIQGEIDVADFDSTSIGFYFLHASPNYCNPNFIALEQCIYVVYCNHACSEIFQKIETAYYAALNNDHDTVRISLQQIDVQQSLHPDCFID
jgi:hypothetical protein